MGERQRILITVKTYPTLSRKYGETVCTAGLREDGTWVRLYPVPFRRLDQADRYSKYDWIECRLQRNQSDPRPETFRLIEALLHGPEQIADLPVPVAESPGAVRIGHPERSHLVEYLAPNSVFNSLPRQRSSPHLRPDDRLVTIDRVLHHASLGVA